MIEKWQRDSDVSPAERLWKARRYARALVATPLWTRPVDHVGRGVRCIGRPTLVNFGTMTLGDGVVLRSRPVAVELVASRGGSLHIGPDCAINGGSSIHADRSVNIGARVHIGPYVHIMDTSFHELSIDRAHPDGRPVDIGDDVWLCVKATVLPGVRIGAGAVVAANSVVTRDVPPGVVVAGSPARVVGHVPELPIGRSGERDETATVLCEVAS